MLTAEELQALEKQMRWEIWQFVCCFLLFLASLIWLDELITVSIGLPALLLFGGVGAWRLWKLGGDYNAGFVHVFEGIWQCPVDGTRNARILPLFHRSGRQEVMEVGPNSWRVWSINGRTPKSWLTLRVTSLAKAPAIALETVPLQEIVAADGRSIHAANRALTPEELAELGKQSSRTWVVALLWSIFCTLWIGVPAAFDRLTGKPSQMEPMGYLIICLTVCCYVALGYSIHLARLMKIDRSRGFVLIQRFASLRKFTIAAQDLEATNIEVLPLSQKIWTIEGKPAPWRF